MSGCSCKVANCGVCGQCSRCGCAHNGKTIAEKMNRGRGRPKAERTIRAAAPQRKRLHTTSKPSETKMLLSAEFGFGDLGLNQVDIGHLSTLANADYLGMEL